MNLIPSAAPLRDVLYDFSLAKCVPDAQLLDDFVRRFPQYADSLTEFAIELAMDALRPEPEVDAEAVIDLNRVSPEVSRAISRFHDRLYAVRQATKPTSNRAPSPEVADAPNPFAELSRAAFRALADRIGVNTVFVVKLRDHQIKPDTIPSSFLRCLADALNTPLDLVTAYLAAPSTITSRQFYKADDKPDDSRQQSFVEAVKNSELSEDQQHQLLSF
ncbi:MAG: hypothetical protein OXH81_06755 [Gemmatimonadetes bacterium]|nr:hypothetical protein [Gemmatimonadota bacterium]